MPCVLIFLLSYLGYRLLFGSKTISHDIKYVVQFLFISSYQPKNNKQVDHTTYNNGLSIAKLVNVYYMNNFDNIVCLKRTNMLMVHMKIPKNECEDNLLFVRPIHY